jgi:hypothetical protein
MDPYQTSAANSVAPEVTSVHVKEFLKSFEVERNYYARQETTSVLQVSRAASAVAQVYERLRQAIDYQDEAVLRRRAIARILTRRLTRTDEGAKVLAEGLIKELAWARYIDYIVPSDKVDQTAQILDRYLYLMKQTLYRQSDDLPNLREWIVGVCATEIERNLVPPFVYDALALLMYQTLDFSERIEGVDEATKNLQIYLAIQRTLLHADNALMRYHLLTSYYPLWSTGDPETLQRVTTQFVDTVRSIEYHLHHPLADRLFPLMRRQIGSYLIFKDVCTAHKKENLLAVLAEKNTREEYVREQCRKRYGQVSAKIVNTVIRSIIFLFITKSLLALAIEVPVERILTNKIHIVPLMVNVFFPPALMTIVALGIRPPGEKNTDKILDRINSMCEDSDGSQKIKFRMPPAKRRGGVFYLVYLAFFMLSFGLASYVLTKIGATLLSAVLFFMFTCLVSFFAYRIQNNARELVVVDERGTFVSGLFDFLFFPFMRIGRYLSEGISKINIFIFVFDFILEAPIKSVTALVEDWFSFVREKKEEIV